MEGLNGMINRGTDGLGHQWCLPAMGVKDHGQRQAASAQPRLVQDNVASITNLPLPLRPQKEGNIRS